LSTAVRAGAGAASCRDEADADARGERERRTVEEGVEVVVVDLAELEEVLARPRAGLDLEVDDQVPERRLEQHRHARLRPAQVQNRLHEYTSQRARRVECRMGVNVEDKLVRSGPPLLSLCLFGQPLSLAPFGDRVQQQAGSPYHKKRDRKRLRDHCPCNRKKKGQSRIRRRRGERSRGPELVRVAGGALPGLENVPIIGLGVCARFNRILGRDVAKTDQ
jgi:hypothetical protein